MLKVLVIMQVIFESNWTFSCLVLQNINVALIAKLPHIMRVVITDRTHQLRMGRNLKYYGKATTRSSTFLLPLLSSQTCGTLGSHCAPWAPGTQAPPEAPWATCPWGATWAPRLAAGMAVDMEGLLVSPAQNAETDPFVLSGAEYISVCRDCGKYRQVWLIWDHPL